MNFLEKLDFMMNKLGINKSKLSIISGVPYTTIDTFYKKGYENTKLSTIKKISEALDVSMDYLLVDTITDEDYGKSNGFYLKNEEVIHIKKYRLLDPYGKEAVDGVLDVELRRCEADRQEQKDKATPDPNNSLNDEEKEFMHYVHQLKDGQQEMLLDYMQQLLKLQQISSNTSTQVKADGNTP